MKSVMFALLLLVAANANAQLHAAQSNPLLQKVAFSPPLGQTLALQQPLRDADGGKHQLADFFGGDMPVALLFGYYQCHRLCETAIDALARAVKIGDIKARMLFIGIDPRETAADAQRKRASYRRAFGSAVENWHFLSGDQPAIDAIKSSAGLRTTLDGDGNIVHPAGVVLMTPDGRISGFLPGVAIDPAQLRTRLARAARGTIGTPPPPLLLLCSNYDPSTGRYSLSVLRLLQILALVMAVAFIVVTYRRHRRRSTR